MKTVLGIFRAACYSPGMAGCDEAILRAVIEHLEAASYVVHLIHEEDFTADTPMPDVVLHMARSPHTLDILQSWQEAGCHIINSVESIRRVERAALAELCAIQSIPTPKTWIVSTVDCPPENIIYPCWVKRTGSCAQEANDVCRADNTEEYTRSMANLHNRGIHKAVVMEHLEGQCIKFYAVGGTDFFYCFPAYDKWTVLKEKSVTNSSVSPAWKRAMAKLHYLIETAMSAFPPQSKGGREKLQVYGGDAIIGSDGTARLIDLNDWPSFSACRKEAAKAIAQSVMDKTGQKHA